MVFTIYIIDIIHKEEEGRPTIERIYILETRQQPSNVRMGLRQSTENNHIDQF